MLAFVVLLLFGIGSDPLTLAVTPRTGLAPLVIRARARIVDEAARRAARTIDLVVFLPTDGDPLVVVRSSRDLSWATDDQRPNAHAVEATLDAGDYVVVACLHPSGRCVSTAVVVRGAP